MIKLTNQEAEEHRKTVLKLFGQLEKMVDRYGKYSTDYSKVKEQCRLLRTSFVDGTIEGLTYNHLELFTGIILYTSVGMVDQKDKKMLNTIFYQLFKLLFRRKVLV